MSVFMADIGDYRIDRALGEGTVLASESNGRRVVLKMLEPDCLLKGHLHPMIYDRLNRVRELAHLGVANLHAAERDGERAFCVWEFVEGITLQEFLREYGPHDTRLADIATQILSHVETLHGLGIVHGALHARNVIIQPAGGVKLTHVSPLLYHEESVDVQAVGELLKQMGFNRADTCSSLKEFASMIRPALEEQIDSAPEGEHLRRWALIGAIVAAIVGMGVAWFLWRNAANQPREPVSRAAINGRVL
jgi:serine/threonine protein kinase